MGVDAGGSAGLGPDRDHDRVVAEDLLRRPESRLLETAFAIVEAKEAGKPAFGAARNSDQIDAVIRNTFIQGTLSIVFATLVIVVFVTGLTVAVRSIRGGAAPSRKNEPVPSRFFAPSGLIPTAVEKEVQSNGTRYPNRTPDRLVLVIIDGRQPLPTLRRPSAPRPSRRAGRSEREYWRMRHAATDANPNARCC